MNDVLIRFRLVGDEAQALVQWSSNELRSPQQQVKYVLRREFERLGLLQPSPTIPPKESSDGIQIQRG
jgi:hypothetical protein